MSLLPFKIDDYIVDSHGNVGKIFSIKYDTQSKYDTQRFEVVFDKQINNSPKSQNFRWEMYGNNLRAEIKDIPNYRHKFYRSCNFNEKFNWTKISKEEALANSVGIKNFPFRIGDSFKDKYGNIGRIIDVRLDVWSSGIGLSVEAVYDHALHKSPNASDHNYCNFYWDLYGGKNDPHITSIPDFQNKYYRNNKYSDTLNWTKINDSNFKEKTSTMSNNQPRKIQAGDLVKFPRSQITKRKSLMSTCADNLKPNIQEIYGRVIENPPGYDNPHVLLDSRYGDDVGFSLKDFYTPTNIEYFKKKYPHIKNPRFMSFNVSDPYLTYIPEQETNNISDNQANNINNSKKEKTMSNSVVDTLKSDAKEAGYRVASTQIVNGVKAGLVKLFESKGAGSEKMEMLKSLLDSEMGESIVALLLGYGLNYAPGLKDDPRVQKLSEEFRVKGMEVAGNAVVGMAMESFLPVLTKALEALPEEKSQLRLADSSSPSSSSEEEQEEEEVKPAKKAARG